MRTRRCKTRHKPRVSAIELLESRCLLTGPGDFVGDTIAEATNLGALAPGGFLFQFGTIDVAGDVDLFEFRTVTPGLASIQLSADLSVFDAVVTLRDADGNILASNDDFDPFVSTDSFLTFFVEGGRTYFIEAGGFGTSASDFVLSATLDVINVFPAFNLDLGILAAEQPIERFDTLDFAGDFDVFQFQADSDGVATFQLKADFSDLDPVVTLLDSSGNFVATNDDDKPPLVKDSSLTRSVQAGETYYIVASGFRSSFGDYSLSVSLAEVLDLGVVTATQPLQHTDTVEVAGDRDLFQFQVETSGLVVIQLDAANSSMLDPFVTLQDSTGATIAEDDDNGRGLNSFLTYSLVSGQNYFIVVRGFGDITGDYVLSVSLPTVTDLGAVSSTQSLQRTDTISVALESDYFRFDAETSGIATVELTASSDSTLDTVLTVLSPNGAFQTFNDDIEFPLNTNSRLTIAVVAGQTYFLQAEGSFASFSTGNYSLSVSLPGSTSLGILTGTPPPISVNGAINVAGEIDLYQFEADEAGILVLEMDPTDPRTLDTIVTLRNSDGVVLAVNDDVSFPSQRNSRLTFVIEAGETYFIEAGGFGVTTGNYLLNVSLRTDDVSPIVSTQTAFDLGTLSSASSPTISAIGFPGDHDVFQFRVETPSLVSIALNADDPRTLDTILSVLNAFGTQVAFNDDLNFPVNTNSQLSFIAEANQTFFIDVSGFRNGTGFYTLSATAVPAVTATLLDFPTPNFPTAANGTIETAGAISRFRLDPATSNQMFRVEANATSGNLDPQLTVRVIENGAVMVRGFDDDSGLGLNSLLSIPVTIGQVLEIDVSGFGQTLGAFSLVITAPTANNDRVLLDADFALANFALRPGTISQSFERDTFRFTASSDGQVNIDLVTTDRSLDPLLTVSTVTTNSNGLVVGRNDDSPFNFGLNNNVTIAAANLPVTSLNSHLEIDVTAGVTYDIVAQDFSFGTGSYFLVATTTARTDDFADSFDELDLLRRQTPRREIQLDDRHEFGLSSFVSGTISAAVANQSTPDVDLLDFQANFTGVLNLSLALDPNLAVSVFRDVRLDPAAAGEYELIDVLPQEPGRPLLSTLSFPVDDRGIYVVRIAGAMGAGSYQLSGHDANFNNIDQIPDSIANAAPLALNVVATSAIDFRFDRDVYRFVAPPEGGLLTVSLNRTNGSNLDTVLVIYDDKGVPIASNDDVEFLNGRIDSRVTFLATPGAVYYAEATGLGPTPGLGERDFGTGAYGLVVAPANGVENPSLPTGGTSADPALLEAVTVGLVSIANGAGMLGDRNPEAIRNAVVEAVSTLAKQGKLTSDYLVLILDDAPEAGFVLTSPQGVATTVSPGSGVTNLPAGGLVNYGQFAGVALLPVTGGGVPTLQVSGYGSNLGSSFQAAMVSSSGDSLRLPSQQLISSSGSSSDGKVQLTFALGFNTGVIAPIGLAGSQFLSLKIGTGSSDGSGSSGQTKAEARAEAQALANAAISSNRNDGQDRQAPSFFLVSGLIVPGIRTSQRVRQAVSAVLAVTSIEDSTLVRFDDSLQQTIDAPANEAPTIDWPGLFEGVLESLQFGGLSRQTVDRVVERLRESDSKLPMELIQSSPIVRSAKVIYDVVKQGAGWLGIKNGKPPAVKPRSTVPRVTQETPDSKRVFQAGGGSTKTRQLGG